MLFHTVLKVLKKLIIPPISCQLLLAHFFYKLIEFSILKNVDQRSTTTVQTLKSNERKLLFNIVDFFFCIRLPELGSQFFQKDPMVAPFSILSGHK